MQFSTLCRQNARACFKRNKNLDINAANSKHYHKKNYSSA